MTEITDKMRKTAGPGRIVIAGGSGFLGQALADDLLARGYEVVVLTRLPTDGAGGASHARWDGKNLGPWMKHLEGATAVVNFAGKSVNCRYTPKNRAEINASRVDSVKVIDAAIGRCARPPRVLIQAASLAIYGDAGDRVCDEYTEPGVGFPVETCRLWEGAFNSAKTPRTRRVLLRIGFVLGRDGGALATLAKLARWFLGGTVGSGRQFISWLHFADLNRMIRWAMDHDDVQGVYNATCPNPVTNREFMRELRLALGRPWSPPAPGWAVHIGARLMGTEASLALTGRRCVPGRATEAGFDFHFTDLPGALRDIFNSNPAQDGLRTEITHSMKGA